MIVRILTGRDSGIFERFLSGHAETSMYLRGNARRVGLDYEDKDFHADYFGAFDPDENLTGVLAHGRSGRLLMQATDGSVTSALVSAFRETVTRPVSGFLGPDEQVEQTIQELGLSGEAWAMNKNEQLYGVEMKSLISPCDRVDFEMVDAGLLDHSLLTRWIRENERETQGAEEGEELEEDVRRQVKWTMDENHWGLLKNGEPVALSGFTSLLPDIVQVGSVWTPPEHRCHGYARALVAKTLKLASRQGVERAILFTDNPAAVKAYRAIGFEQIGFYRIALLKKAINLNAGPAV